MHVLAWKVHLIQMFLLLLGNGKSRHLGFWKLDELIKSIGNLTELGPHRDPEDYAIPTGGLSECLQSKFALLE